MIEKRYQIFSSEGLSWSKWFHHSDKGTQADVDRLNKDIESKWQLKNKLRNEFRLVN